MASKSDTLKSIAAEYDWTPEALKNFLEPIREELELMRGKAKGKKKKSRKISPKMKTRIYEFLGEPEKTLTTK